MTSAANIQKAVPFFGVENMERSVHFYIEGLGFTFKYQWTPDGKLRWCWLDLGGASLMLQEYLDGRRPEGQLGLGMSVCFMCEDALAIYREVLSRGFHAEEPFVGNGLWVTKVTDPDGYELYFESPTDVAEETRLSEIAA